MMTADAPSTVLPSAGAESVVGLAQIHSRVLVLPILRGGAALVSLLFFCLSLCMRVKISHNTHVLIQNVRVMDLIRFDSLCIGTQRAFLELRRTKSFPERNHPPQ